MHDFRGLFDKGKSRDCSEMENPSSSEHETPEISSVVTPNDGVQRQDHAVIPQVLELSGSEQKADMSEEEVKSTLEAVASTGKFCKMKAKALMECDQYVSKYAQSATGRTFSVVWTCRKQAKELNTCLHQFTNDNVLEEMRRESMLQEEGRPRPYKF